jgi:DNA-binding transcriptional MocR family regulator
VINQVELAAELGISRTPLREALRMLKEEGFVEAEPNRRSRVASFNGAEMDAIYGTRLLLEALAMRLTLPALAPEAVERAGRLLDTLEELGGPAAGEARHRGPSRVPPDVHGGRAGPALFDEAVLANARHLARTPMLILAEMAAGTEPGQHQGSAEHDLFHGGGSSSRQR